jgi:GT2 family glycosyltransferase
MKKVSVIVATYMREDTIAQTIHGLLANTYPAYEVIVVDQTKSYFGNTAQELRNMLDRPNGKYITLSPSSLPFARNVGIRYASGEIVIFCDDDVRLDTNFIANHVHCYDDPTAGAVAGRVLTDGDEDNLQPGAIIAELLPDGMHHANFHSSERREVPFGRGCNMSFRREIFEKVGLFDERYRGGFFREETDLFARVRKAGYKILFEPLAVLEHLQAESGGCRKDEIRTRMYSVFRNEALFFFNCMRLRHLPLFLYRSLRWIYSIIRIHHLPLLDTFFFLKAILAGLCSHIGESPDRLSCVYDAV